MPSGIRAEDAGQDMFRSVGRTKAWGDHALRWGTVGWVAWVLVIIGALNWGLVGFFRYDLVASAFGGTYTALSRIIFALVGVAGLWQIFTVPTQTRARS